MEHIFESAKKLADDIRESKTYKTYLEARAVVYAQPGMVLVLEEYRQLVRDLARVENIGMADEAVDLLPYKQRVSEAYFNAVQDDRFLNYFEAERFMVAMICDVLEIVAGEGVKD